jgi:hypothetical protein
MRSARPSAVAFVLPLILTALLLAIFPAAPSSAATAPGIEWTAVIDAWPDAGPASYVVMQDVVPTGDGGRVAAGYAIPPYQYISSDTAQEALVVRFDAAGREVWRAFLGDGLAGPGNFETRRIRGTSDGGFVVGCTSFLLDSPGPYYYTSFLAKLDAAGNPVWRLDFDPTQLDELGDFDILPDGSILAAGGYWDTSRGGMASSTAVAKVSPDGRLLWLRSTDPDIRSGVRKLAAAPDGGFYACSEGGVYVSRYGADGNILWGTELTGIDGNPYYFEKIIHGIGVDPAGGAVLYGAGRTTNGVTYGAFRPFTASFDASGRQTGAFMVPTSSYWNFAVERLADGGLVSAEGVEGSDAGVYLVRYDAAGLELWRVPVGAAGDEPFLEAIRATPDGKLVAAGGFRRDLGTDDAPWGVLKGYVVAFDGGGVAAAPPATATDVRIDVLPGNPVNPVNAAARGLLPVALLSSAGFDAARVDPASVTLDGAPVARAGRFRFHAVRRDVDGDRRADLLLWFDIPALRLAPGATSVTLRGTTVGGVSFSGTDRVRVQHPRRR